MMAELKEMQRIKQNAFCCGAGGGLKKGYPELAMKVAKTRLKEAEDTGADTIVSICPFCFRNLKDAIEDTGSKMKMIDLMELVIQAI